MENRAVLLGILCVLLAGCSASESQPSVEKSQGRAETKKIEAVSASGYDGKAIRKSVDNALDKNDDHNRDLEKGQK